MARDKNTFAKRQRDFLKKQKQEDKKARRIKRKEAGKSADDTVVVARPESEA